MAVTGHGQDTDHANSPRAVLLLAGLRNTEGMIIRFPNKAAGSTEVETS